MNKLIFILIFSTVFLSANFYVFIRGYQALPAFSWLKITYSILFWVLSISFIVSRATGQEKYFLIHTITTWVGTFWMVASLFFFVIVLTVDIIRVFNHFIHFLPLSNSPQYQLIKLILLCTSIFTVSSLLIYGNYNARHPKVVELKLKIDKPGGKHQKLRIAMASDIHLGTILNTTSLNRLTSSINSYHPDIVIFAGDILDEELSPIIRDDIGKPLKNIVSPLGVWAIPGNHEYIGNFAKAANYLKSLNINLLVDSTVLIDSSFYLVGRDDKDANRFAGKKRAELATLMSSVDRSKPIILLDHQPFKLYEGEKEGVDLQLSGHTHQGQFFPITLIVKRMYEDSWGYLKKGNTNIYVSSGYGTWGASVRIGTQSELVIIDVDFLN
jgi:hypothetical protein